MVAHGLDGHLSGQPGGWYLAVPPGEGDSTEARPRPLGSRCAVVLSVAPAAALAAGVLWAARTLAGGPRKQASVQPSLTAMVGFFEDRHLRAHSHHRRGVAEVEAHTSGARGNCTSDPESERIDGEASPCEGTPSGSTCAFKCVHGYTASGSVACHDGRWGDWSCDPNPCYEDPVTDHIHGNALHCQGTPSGATCDLVCLHGYTASAKSKATCFAGSWDIKGGCEELRCAHGPRPEHADFEHLEDCTNVKPGGHCNLVCADGYFPSGNFTCTLGAYDNQTCEPEPCQEDPDILHIDKDESPCERTRSDDSCIFRCESGWHPRYHGYSYTPLGEIRCSVGKWDPGICDPDACDHNPDIPHLDFVRTKCAGKLSGMSCPLACLKGYTPSDDAKCSEGQWDSQSCVPEACMEDPVIENLDLSASNCEGTPSGLTCAFTCNSGFSPRGEVMCQSGSWETEECDPTMQDAGACLRATCEPNSCMANPVIDGLNGETSKCEGTPAGKSCAFRCTKGYKPSGSVTCAKGKWGSEASCEAEPCTRAPKIAHGAEHVCDETLSGQTCAFKCADGYAPSGVLTCSKGAWDVHTCDPAPCHGAPSIDDVDLLETDCDATRSGGTCAFKCLQGFTPSALATCAKGSWHDNVTCDPESCKSNPDLSYMDDAATHCAGTISDHSCAFKCEKGYRPSSAKIECLQGAWDTFSTICAPEACSDLDFPHLDSASTLACKDTASGDSCPFKCQAGFEPIGVSQCLTGRWMLGASCAPLPCARDPFLPHIELPQGGCANTASGEACAVQCEEGYGPPGKVICARGAWAMPAKTPCDTQSETAAVTRGNGGGHRPQPSPSPHLGVKDADGGKAEGGSAATTAEYDVSADRVLPSTKQNGEPEDDHEIVMRMKEGAQWCAEEADCTVADAEKYCTVRNWCLGFSFPGDGAENATPSMVVFKGVLSGELRTLTGWHTYTRRAKAEPARLRTLRN